MSIKNQVTERPRPDPLMWASRWSGILLKQGLDFASAIDDRIKTFNSNKTEGFGILDYEVAFIMAFRRNLGEALAELQGSGIRSPTEAPRHARLVARY